MRTGGGAAGCWANSSPIRGRTHLTLDLELQRAAEEGPRWEVEKGGRSWRVDPRPSHPGDGQSPELLIPNIVLEGSDHRRVERTATDPKEPMLENGVLAGLSGRQPSE